ncbi:gas vesicle protein K, partial [Patescibacteria group bacterium]|nr:gas vesicle protein K [Patescibacteria group bacterium]
VLTLVKLIKDLMYREARRRIKKGSLSDAEIQKLGLTFKALDKKVEEIRAIFGLEDEELNIDLGPLGKLM